MRDANAPNTDTKDDTPNTDVDENGITTDVARHRDSEDSREDDEHEFLSI